MIIKIDKEGSQRNLENMLAEVESNSLVKAIMVLACDANGFTPSNADHLFTKLSKPVFGGIFPQVLTESENLVKGTIVAGISQDVSLFVLKNISNPDVDIDQLLALPFQGKPVIDKTTFLFVDGMSRNIVTLLDSTFNHFGLKSNYIGGGAGSMSFRPIPCIITSEGILQDAAIFAFADMISGVGVAHGWHPVSHAMKVTETSYNTVVSIDWKPAYEVYREIISKETKLDNEKIVFDEVARSFPLGVVKMADELLVRDPVKCINNSMVCLGELPLNSFVYVLKGNSDSLLAGARKSRMLAEDVYYSKMDRKQEETPPIAFFIDCITRVLFLGDKFKEELRIASGGNKLIGALSLGEIANSGSDYLEFYNKTSVVGIVQN
jgi:hypothetical protein